MAQWWGGTLFLVLLAGIVVQGEAQAFTLTDGNSVVAINASSPAGMTSYQVNGVNQVKGQWFYYRIGDIGPESSIDTIGGLVSSQPDARNLSLTYANSQYSASVAYKLTGGTAGLGSQSSLNETIVFLNKSATPLNLRFFDYSDFDLNGVSGGQSLQFNTTTIPTLRTNKFTQTMGVNYLTTTLSSSTRATSLVEAATYSQTLTSLTDLNLTTLNGAMGPVSGDVTGTFEWDVTLAAGASLQISSLIYMVVPEPSVLGLFALGLAATLYRRCRTRRTGF